MPFGAGTSKIDAGTALPYDPSMDLFCVTRPEPHRTPRRDIVADPALAATAYRHRIMTKRCAMTEILIRRGMPVLTAIQVANPAINSRWRELAYLNLTYGMDGWDRFAFGR